MKKTELKPGTKRLKRKSPAKGPTPPRANPKGRAAKKRKSKTRRKRLEGETEKRQKKFYLKLPCVICRWQGIWNTNTCGHHIVPKGRCRIGRHDPANIMPVCPSHHTMGGDIATESSSALVVARYVDFMDACMPARWAVARGLEEKNKGQSGQKMTICEIERDHALWEKICREEMTYEAVCEMEGVEAFAGESHEA